MKRILSLSMALALTAPQAFSYSVEDLKEVEGLTASITTASAMLNAMVPDNLNKSLAQIGEFSKEANNLVAYAIEDQSFQVRIARVINRIATKASWQKAQEIDGAFLKNFSIELTHGVTAEVANYFQGKALATLMPNVSDSRIVNRAAHALATAVVTSLLETTFMHINRYAELPSTENTKCTEKLLGTFAKTLVTEAAYQLAGEAILRGANNAKTDTLSDICAAECNVLDSSK